MERPYQQLKEENETRLLQEIKAKKHAWPPFRLDAPSSYPGAATTTAKNVTIPRSPEGRIGFNACRLITVTIRTETNWPQHSPTKVC